MTAVITRGAGGLGTDKGVITIKTGKYSTRKPLMWKTEALSHNEGWGGGKRMLRHPPATMFYSAAVPQVERRQQRQPPGLAGAPGRLVCGA